VKKAKTNFTNAGRLFVIVLNVTVRDSPVILQIPFYYATFVRGSLKNKLSPISRYRELSLLSSCELPFYIFTFHE